MIEDLDPEALEEQSFDENIPAIGTANYEETDIEQSPVSSARKPFRLQTESDWSFGQGPDPDIFDEITRLLRAAVSQELDRAMSQLVRQMQQNREA